MSLQRAKSIFFLHDVRVSRAISGASARGGATRISLVDDDRYHVYVEQGIEAQIRDSQLGITIHVPWHVVRDYELTAAEAATEPETPKAKAAHGAQVPRTLA